jgi:four helix bundle suffix protein
VAANTLLCLINQASSLLRSQMRQLEQDFLANGGIRERMSKARLDARANQTDKSDVSDSSDKLLARDCPFCGKPMRQRTARTGPHAGQPFWGCTGYPECKGIRSVQK